VTAKHTVPVRIQGKEYRIRAEADAETVARAALLLDETMDKIRARSGTADSVDIAVLAALNLANVLTAERASSGTGARMGDRVLELIRLVESAVGDAKPAAP
jgi:cell division protein ZapA (FtsZ GTPase activity inhibitor)